jgi:alpha/beta superfamily hydrolase
MATPEGAFTWGDREPEDVAAVAASLRAHYGRVGGLGFSFGGHHVGTAAARHRPFDAVALVAAPRHVGAVTTTRSNPALAQHLPLMLRRRRRPHRLADAASPSRGPDHAGRPHRAPSRC